MTTVEDVVGSLDRLMGVKAVWGRSAEAVMCFGARKNAHYSVARRTAERAVTSPYLITIGGGEEVTDEMRGRALELIRVTSAYGDTSAFVKDPILLKRLERWPIAVMTSEVFEIEGEPDIISDLGLVDRRILENAYDTVKDDQERLPVLWKSVKSHRVNRKWQIQPPDDFADPGKVVACGSQYPRKKFTKEEGQVIIREIQTLERDRALSQEVKDINKRNNGGFIICEGCDLSDDRQVLFDAHHLRPLCAGPRKGHTDNFAVLCPTCHRWAHCLGPNRLIPLSISEVRAARKASTP